VTALQATSATNPSEKAWRTHGAALAALIFLILVAYRADVEEMVFVWWIYPTYSHAFLILPISLWLVWEKRARLRELRPFAERHALWALPVMLFVWWMGELSTINELKQFAIVALVVTAIFAMLGRRIFKLIWFPVLYLFFLVPTGQYLIAPMQRFATAFTDYGLNLLNIAHYTHGTFIELTNGAFEVAEACAGLRFMIATVALGVIFAYITYRKWYKVALFLLACVIVPLVGNGLRVLGIIVLAHYTNNEYGAGADHVVYGWGFNIAILLVLFLLGSFFRDPIIDQTPISALPAESDSLPRLWGVFAAAAILTLATPALASWYEDHAPSPDVAALTRPMSLGGWHVVEGIGDWKPDYSGAAATLNLSIAPNAPVSETPVDLYVAYYAQARAGHELTAHISHLWNLKTMKLLSSGQVVAQLQTKRLKMQELVITSPIAQRIIWSTFWIDERFTSSSFATKLLQVPAALTGHEGQAIVAVSTIVTSNEGEARLRLRAALLALKDLPDRLAAAGHRRVGTNVTN
jgi:exosortase A